MKKRFHKLSSAIICISFAFLLLIIALNIGTIWGAVCNIATILTPIVYAFGIAYILNFPYRFFSKKVFSKIKAPWFQKFIKPLSLFVTYVIVFGIIIFMIVSLVPQLLDNISALVKSLPTYKKSFAATLSSITNWLSQHGIDVSNFNSINKEIGNFFNSVFSIKNFQNVSGVVISTGVTFYNIFIGIILSIYMISSKEFLLRQLKKFATAFLPTPWLPTMFKAIDITDDKCGKFMVGKVLESTILGFMFFIVMTIIGLPYALLISVMMAICNIIPFFGPFIGGIPSALLLFMISPIDCLIFVITMIVLTQVDGNIIGPKIVGSQVGLTGFWSLASVVIAGGLFGLAGMIIGTPIFAAFYTLMGEIVNKRVKMKGENAEKVLAIDVLNSSKLTNINSEDFSVKKIKEKTHKMTHKDKSTSSDEEETTDNKD